ncbi:major tail protein [Lactococcus phage P092]|uniref:BIG2 domain-containing protein n=1 Tax=Lactococcus phage P092 TaxID=1476887 RepID=X4YGN3_9CAUD|nr:major tail protein [Lactococcus phage P092]AHV83055.1 hypothetical protein P092_0014 [Lactococcus phage P092]
MSKLTWDVLDEREYETGVDHGVLYLYNQRTRSYDSGVVWNGLTGISESPDGAESNPQYADNMKYLNLISAENFGFTINAFGSPKEFDECDGNATPVAGVTFGQQARKMFGFAYRTLIGDGSKGTDKGYKLKLIYGAQAAPSSRDNNTVNDSPEIQNPSWECTTTPVDAGEGFKPTAFVIIDSTTADQGKLKALEDILFGSSSTEPRLPLPAEIVSLLSGGSVNVPVKGISLNKTTVSKAVGSAETLIATVTPDNATNKTVNWTSSHPEFATVDSSGKVTPVKAGVTNIVAEVGGKSATCVFTVTG